MTAGARADGHGPFAAACRAGDVATLRVLLDDEPALATADLDGTTGLHLAVHAPEAVKLLLERGADANARDTGDRALPLHFAAAAAPLESVHALLDAGSDVHGHGDLHELDVIGWATCFEAPRSDVVTALLDRGAEHHVFSAIASGDAEVVRRVIRERPDALRRRLSRFEQEQTPLHYVVAPPDGLVGGTFRNGEHYDLLDVLLAAGSDTEATDATGRTALEVAMLRGDREAMRRLHAAGASLPPAAEPLPHVATASEGEPASLAASVEGLRPMLPVRDVAETIAWYRSIGFELTGSHGEGGRLDWAEVRLGPVEIMFVPADPAGVDTARRPSLWIGTSRIDDLYAVLSRRQLARATAALAGDSSGHGPEIPFTVGLHEAFYGLREFGIRDPDGVEIMFCQAPDEGTEP